MKYVVVSGGVVSGLGKGITSSSIGVLLQSSGLRVTSIKIDPYLNSDAGTMSPYEHGEVFVLDDGGEADLDLGNYERFLDCTLTKDHNITTGKVYAQVINRERKGDYLGKTVQVVPHVTDAINDWIHRASHLPVDESRLTPEVCLIELGGTVGDIESSVFLEALRQYRYKVGSDNFCLVHVSLVPVVSAVGEPKSKPTQHSVEKLRAAGLQPDLIVCRSSAPLDRATQSKISQFCMVAPTHVISVHDVSNIYKVPLLMQEQRVGSMILNCLRLHRMPPEDLPTWRALSEANPERRVSIAIVGKYTGLSDSYLSVIKSLDHAGIANEVHVDIKWLDSSLLEDATKSKAPAKHAQAWSTLTSVNGILVPGGFGNRGIDGKIAAICYAREHQVPFLGICLGMQVAVIEFARHVCSIEDATSAEFDAGTEHDVIFYMPEIDRLNMGGTMRLGSRKTLLTPGTLAAQLYGGEREVFERHRHRYEVKPDYIQQLTNAGLIFSGTDDRNERMECIEIADHPFFFGCQYHPEFKSRPFRSSPPFKGFVAAAAGKFVRNDLPLIANGAKANGSQRRSQRSGSASAATSASHTPVRSTSPSPSPSPSPPLGD